MRVFFSAGEASGDAYAAVLAGAIRNEIPDATFEGVGGKRLAAAGATLVADSSAWGAIGIAQVARIYFRALKGLKAAQRALAEGRPGLFVPIDYGYMNMKLCRSAKAAGWKVLYFSPPGAWRRDRQGADLPRLTDAIVTPFSWSADMLNGMGANAHWFGHPIKEMIRGRERHAEADRTSIAILPGSRRSEVELLLPVLAEAVRPLDRICEFAVAPNFDPVALRAKWLQFAPGRTEDRFTAGDTYGVLSRARAGIVCSGTATLEAALCACPHVVVYRVDGFTALQARLMGYTRDKMIISQPNLFLQRLAVPELIQDEAQPAAIMGTLHALLEDSPERAGQLEAFRELDAVLGGDQAMTETGRLAAALTRSGPDIPER